DVTPRAALNAGTNTTSLINVPNMSLVNNPGFTVNQGAVLQVDSALHGSATLNFNKNSAGKIILTSSGTDLSGPVNVNAGTMIAANTGGSATGSGTVTVFTGAALGGNGTINGQVNVNAGGI